MIMKVQDMTEGQEYVATIPLLVRATLRSEKEVSMPGGEGAQGRLLTIVTEQPLTLAGSLDMQGVPESLRAAMAAFIASAVGVTGREEDIVSGRLLAYTLDSEVQADPIGTTELSETDLKKLGSPEGW
jgi:hypothetical protein